MHTTQTSCHIYTHGSSTRQPSGITEKASRWHRVPGAGGESVRVATRTIIHQLIHPYILTSFLPTLFPFSRTFLSLSLFLSLSFSLSLSLSLSLSFLFSFTPCPRFVMRVKRTTHPMIDSLASSFYFTNTTVVAIISPLFLLYMQRRRRRKLRAPQSFLSPSPILKRTV